MSVVVHQTVGVATPPAPIKHLCEQGQETRAIVIVHDDEVGHAFVTALIFFRWAVQQLILFLEMNPLPIRRPVEARDDEHLIGEALNASHA
ncbi:MAG: hypothetical protein JSR62_04210 [Nitrospira sp.]|nr:hypothetical protein [Nitrospira sp.]